MGGAAKNPESMIDLGWDRRRGSTALGLAPQKPKQAPRRSKPLKSGNIIGPLANNNETVFIKSIILINPNKELPNEQNRLPF